MAQDFSALTPIKVGFTNCYPIATEEGVALIDTGSKSEALWDALNRGLKERGHSLSDVRLVLLTHSHSDHSGLADRVREASGAKVGIHELDAPYLKYGQGRLKANQENIGRLMLACGVPQELLDWFYAGVRRGNIWPKSWRQAERLFGPSPDYRVRLEALSAFSYEEAHAGEASQHGHGHGGHQHQGGHGERPVGGVNFTPDFTFGDGEKMALGGLTLTAVHTPGHTPGHTCYYHQDSGAVFTGDHILKRITPNPGIHFYNEEYETRMRSLPEYLRSLRKLMSLKTHRVLPAHEEEVFDLPGSLERLFHHHERRGERTLKAVLKGKERPFDVLPHVFPALRAFALIPAMAEIVGHLDLLEEGGLVRLVHRDDSIFCLPADGAGK